jgi:hypothetical protein
MNSDLFTIISVFDLPMNLVKSSCTITKRVVNWNIYAKELDDYCTFFNYSKNNMTMDVEEELRHNYKTLKRFIHDSYKNQVLF